MNLCSLTATQRKATTVLNAPKELDLRTRSSSAYDRTQTLQQSYFQFNISTMMEFTLTESHMVVDHAPTAEEDYVVVQDEDMLVEDIGDDSSYDMCDEEDGLMAGLFRSLSPVPSISAQEFQDLDTLLEEKDIDGSIGASIVSIAGDDDDDETTPTTRNTTARKTMIVATMPTMVRRLSSPTLKAQTRTLPRSRKARQRNHGHHLHPAMKTSGKLSSTRLLPTRPSRADHPIRNVARRSR